jgi:hypothetical protein
MEPSITATAILRSTTQPPARPGAGAVELAGGLWRLVPPSRVDRNGTGDLRDACLDALDRGAVNVFLDVTGVELICEDALDVLDSVRESLLARGGLLWVAVERERGHAFAVTAVDERGLAAAAGLSDVLDRAIDERRKERPRD